jgi:hypothetical protein
VSRSASPGFGWPITAFASLWAPISGLGAWIFSARGWIMTWSCSPLPCRSTLRPLQVPMNASENWTLPARRGSKPCHPLLSHPTHLPTSTPSPSRWSAFVCMPTRRRLLRALSPTTSTTRGWSVSLTPSWDHTRPRKISIASTSSSPMPWRSSRGDHHSPRR